MDTVKIEIGSRLYNFVKTTFPSYKKKKVFMHIHDATEKNIKTHPGGWDGGSIDYDYTVDMIPAGVMMPKKAHQATLFNFDRELGFPQVHIDDHTCMVTDGVVASKPSTLLINCTRAFWNNHLRE